MWYYFNNEQFRGCWVTPKSRDGLMRVVLGSAARWRAGALPSGLHHSHLLMKTSLLIFFDTLWIRLTNSFHNYSLLMQMSSWSLKWSVGERVSGLRDPPCRAQQRPSRVLTLTEASGRGSSRRGCRGGTHLSFSRCAENLFISELLSSFILEENSL